MGTILFSAEEELRRLVGGSSALEPAVTETIDVSDFNGSATFDIETIGGVAVENFTHIQISCVDLVRSSTGSHMEMELRQQGGAFTDENYRWQGTSSVARNPSTADFEITDATTANTHDCIIFMSSVNQPCPTIIEHSNLNTAASFPAFHRGMTTGATVHDAIRFIANGGGGSETWVSGSVVITGYRCKVGTLYTTAFSSTTEVLIDLANGEYIADLAYSNLTLSTALGIGITVGTGDTYVTSGYRFSLLDAVGSSTGTTGFGFSCLGAGGGTTGAYGFGRLYNLQTAAPVCFQGQILQADGTDANPQEIRSYVQESITPYDQLRFAVNTGNITSGTLYVQTYKPRRTILLAEDLTSYGSVSVEKTGLKKNNASLIVLASTNAESASVAPQSFVRFGTSGGYGTDYQRLQVDEGFDDAGTSTVHTITDFDATGRTGRAVLATIVGLPQPTQTQVTLAMDITSGLSSNVLAHGGRRNTTAAEDRMTVQVGGGAVDWNAGTLWATGYSM